MVRASYQRDQPEATGDGRASTRGQGLWWVVAILGGGRPGRVLRTQIGASRHTVEQSSCSWVSAGQASLPGDWLKPSLPGVNREQPPPTILVQTLPPPPCSCPGLPSSEHECCCVFPREMFKSVVTDPSAAPEARGRAWAGSTSWTERTGHSRPPPRGLHPAHKPAWAPALKWPGWHSRPARESLGTAVARCVGQGWS